MNQIRIFPCLLSLVLLGRLLVPFTKGQQNYSTRFAYVVEFVFIILYNY